MTAYTPVTVSYVADLSRAIDINPGYAWAIARRGQAYLAVGRYDEALADFSCAIDIGPSRAWIIASCGQAYHATGQSDKAHADFTRAIELDPEIAFMTATSVARITTDDGPGSVDPRTDD